MRTDPLAVGLSPAMPTPRPRLPPGSAVPGVPHKGIPHWLLAHPLLAVAAMGVLVIAGTALAALLIRQDVTATVTAVAPDVVFQKGVDYPAINTAGYATLALGTSAASATLALSGVSGAATVSMTNVLNLTNQNASRNYSVTLTRSAVPNVALTDLTVTVKNGVTTVATWNVTAAASSSAFPLLASTRLDVSIQSTVADGTAAGSLGAVGIQFGLVPT